MDRSTYVWDFFIAHAGPDEPVARELHGNLTPKTTVFLDSAVLLEGDDWDAELASAQKASHVTVVLVSGNTQKAYYQREEIAAALAMARQDDQKHRVVPIYLDGAADDVDIPYGLRLKHGIQLAKGAPIAEAAKRLLTLLERLRGRGDRVHGPDGRKLQNDAARDFRGILHEPPADWISPVKRNRWRYKLAAFDLDGTLLRGPNYEFSWEAIWRGLGFGRGIQNELKRQYRQRSGSDVSRADRIRAYQDWCDRACAQFKGRGLTRQQLREMCQPLDLTNSCREALAQMRNDGLVVAIISGGVDTFLEEKFPDFRDYVDFVFINRMLFAENGALEGVKATEFDFQGKAEALELVTRRIGCTPEEAVFVGDHYNDEHIMLKVDKAIAYPPQDEVAEGVSHVAIHENSLLKVVPHVLVE